MNFSNPLNEPGKLGHHIMQLDEKEERDRRFRGTSGSLQYWCIFCTQLAERRATVEKEFQKHGLKMNWWQSIHSRSFGIVGQPWGATELVDHPHSVNAGYVGLAIGFWTLWQHLLLSDHPGPFMIFEDDVILVDDFREKLATSCDDLPEDWQLVLVGSPWGSVLSSPPPIKGTVCETGDGNCWGTHAIMFRKSSLRFLMDVNHRAELPIDAQLNKTSYRQLKTYAFAPSLAHQRSCLPGDHPMNCQCTCE